MAYTYKVEIIYDELIPQTALLGFAPTGIAMHWTAGNPGRQGALETRSYFISSRARVNASYHILVWWDAVTRIFGVMWIVDPGKAAHSMAPKPVAAGGSYDPNAEVRRILGAKVNDPNAGTLAVSFCGMPADLVAAMADPDFVHGYKRLISELQAIPSILDRPLFNHGWAQPTTRYDAGTDLIPAIYGEAPSQGEDDMQFWKPVQEDWHAVNGTVFYDGEGTKKTFTSSEPIRTIAESNDGRWRLAKYGLRELLVIDARTAAKEGAGLVPVSNTRIPATGFGFPTPEIKVVERIVEKTVEVPDPETASKAVAGEQARIRTVLGI